MGFLKALGKIGRGVQKGVSVAAQVGGGVAPIVGLLPGGSLAITLINALQAVEAIIPQEGAGLKKKEIALAMITAAHPELKPDDVSESVDLIVKAFNLIADKVEKAEVPPQ